MPSSIGLVLAKQKTIDPTRMGGMQEMRLLEDESGGDLTVTKQKSHKQRTELTQDQKNARKKHNRRTAKEINR